VFGLDVGLFSRISKKSAWSLLSWVAITAAHIHLPVVVTHHFTSTKSAGCNDVCALVVLVLDIKSCPILFFYKPLTLFGVHDIIPRSRGCPPFKESLDPCYIHTCLLSKPFLELLFCWLTPKEVCCKRKDVLLVMKTIFN